MLVIRSIFAFTFTVKCFMYIYIIFFIFFEIYVVYALFLKLPLKINTSLEVKEKLKAIFFCA